MKIFYWSPFFSKIATIQAVIRSAESLIQYEKQKKYDVSIVNAIGEWEEYRKSIDKKINIINLNNTNLINIIPKNSYIKSRLSYIFIFLFNFFKLKRLIKQEQPNYLIIHLITSLPILLSIFFKKKTKIILRISGLPKINILRYFFWKLFSNNIYIVTCPTKATYDYFKQKKIFSEEKLIILKDPVIDIEKFKNQSKEKIENKFLEKKIIIGIGRLTKQKNFELLVNFFLKIEKDYPEYILIILGEGENRHKLEKIIKDFKLQNKIYILGHQNNVYKYLKNSKYFILSSLWEDPGFVLIEAALSNSTIISSDCPNGPDEIIVNKNFLFKNNNLEDLYKKFQRIEDNPHDLTVLNQKILVKKRIKEFTKFWHYKSLNKLLN